MWYLKQKQQQQQQQQKTSVKEIRLGVTRGRECRETELEEDG